MKTTKKVHARTLAGVTVDIRGWLSSFILPVIIGVSLGVVIAPPARLYQEYPSIPTSMSASSDSSTSTPQYETSCSNMVDDDSDSLVDCDDIGDCSYDPACVEICDNEIDDDGDGAVDCNDLSCDFDPACFKSGSSKGSFIPKPE
jgi:hypothetical protein